MGSYRRGQANDPDMYVASIAAVLTDYSEEVRTYVTDPRTGVQNRVKFLPEVFEVREACEAAMESIRAAERRMATRARAEQQLRERAEWEASMAEPRPTLEQLKTKYGVNWGSDQSEQVRKPRALTLDEIAMKYGVAKDIVEHLPDSRKDSITE